MKQKILIPTDKFLSEVVEYGNELLEDLTEFIPFHVLVTPEPPRNDPKYINLLNELKSKVPQIE